MDLIQTRSPDTRDSLKVGLRSEQQSLRRIDTARDERIDGRTGKPAIVESARESIYFATSLSAFNAPAFWAAVGIPRCCVMSSLLSTLSGRSHFVGVRINRLAVGEPFR